jgi:hypothetical protein
MLLLVAHHDIPGLRRFACGIAAMDGLRVVREGGNADLRARCDGTGVENARPIAAAFFR